MPAVEHPAYPEERERLTYTLDYVARTLEATLRQKSDLDQEIRRLDRACNDENSQAYIDLIVKTNIQSGLALRLRNLHAAKSRPYFARIDFREDDADAEKLYLGKMCLLREEDQGLVIVDWRAAVANLYYEGRLGRTSYRCPAGEIVGELTLKRQYSVADGELREIFDLDLVTTDEFLGRCLGGNAKSRLKEIVSTIQTEQNRIIRAPMETPLIVQGAAGSGKTTIALHRIAYLIYNYGEAFVPENFMIVAPNRLFLSYISEVLPELGVERVKQTTFEDFAVEVIGTRLKIREANEKLLLFLEGGRTAAEEESHRLLREAAAFKSSLGYRDILERYIEGLEETLLPQDDLQFDRWVFATAAEIRRLFQGDYGTWPAFRRLELIGNYLTKRVRERVAEIAQGLQEECTAAVKQIKEAMEESEVRRRFILQTIERKEDLVRRLGELASSGVKGYLRRIPRRGVLEYYRDFLADPAQFKRLAAAVISAALRDFTADYSLANLAAGTVEIEDLAPLLYLKYRLYGLDDKIKVRHLIIDEAQDFSVFQLFALRKIIRDSSFTILGDLAQGIHSYRGARSWAEMGRGVFGDCGCEILTLERSYRTTIEIMSAANLVLAHLDRSDLVKAVPVLRHGEAVRIVGESSPAEAARDMVTQIREAKRRGFGTIAVIAKTAGAGRDWHDRLQEAGFDAPVITGREGEYRGGVVIVPAYLAKGLEFDLVLIADAGRDTYGENELDIKLLYVAMTRALHQLVIYHGGEPTPLLEEPVSNRPSR